MTHTIEVSGAAFILDRDDAEPYSVLAGMVLPKSIEGTGQQMRQLRGRLGHQMAKRSRARFDVGSTRLKREHQRCPKCILLRYDGISAPRLIGLGEIVAHGIGF